MRRLTIAVAILILGSFVAAQKAANERNRHGDGTKRFDTGNDGSDLSAALRPVGGLEEPGCGIQQCDHSKRQNATEHALCCKCVSAPNPLRVGPSAYGEV